MSTTSVEARTSPDPEPPVGAEPGGRPGLAARWAWLVRRFHTRWWPTGLGFLVLACTAMLTSAPGRYVGDNRFEIYVNPARRLARSMVLWDGSRGLGRVREDLWPATTAVPAVFRSLGADPVLAEHLWHGVVLTIAGLGTVALVRLFRPRIGIEHVLAGLFVMFGPFSAAFLLPSNLFFHVALAPWFVVVAYRGIHEDRPWRWAAAFALLVFAPGNADLPGLVYNLVPLVPLGIYVLVVDRSARVRDVLGWVARAAALAVWVSIAILTKTYFAAAALGQRLQDTESASAAALTSSWAESFRGLGNWLSYFPREGGLLKPQGLVYQSSTWVVLATFVPPVIAVAAVARMRWRPRVLFGAMALVSLIVMVGAYPLDDQAPFGSVMLDLLEQVASLAIFRNTYKIGAGYVLGVGALFGVGVVVGTRWLRSRDRRLVAPAVVLVAIVLAGISVPFWTGGVYDDELTSGPVPDYWTEAMTWLDAQPGGERVLVLPEGSRLGYRWGWVGDDLFDALLARDHAVSTGVPLSTPIGASLLEAVSQSSYDPIYRPGSLAPVARRLGIDTVVLRNDVDWQTMRLPRPAAYQGIRNDPDWARVASFGEPGTDTTAPNDLSADADYERGLPPVEVYALRSDTAGVNQADTGVATVVSGDGFAWPAMALAGLLADDRPTLPSGALTDDQLAEALGDGGPVVITDTNRRRLRVLIGFEPDYSHTLADEEDLDRPTQELFDSPVSQSLAWFPDAVRIYDTGSPRALGGSSPWLRPAMAFDGNPVTAWQVGRIDRPAGRRLHVDLRAPTTIGQMRLVPTRSGGTDGITKARLHFSDGSTEDVDLREGATVATFEPRSTDWFEVEVLELGGEAALSPSVGFSDIGVPGLDLREFIQVPEDIFRRGDADPAVAASIAEAPTTYLFERRQVSDRPDEETAIRRRFRTAGERTFTLSGTFRARASTSDIALNELVGGPVAARSGRRLSSDLTAWAGYAVDGDPTTAWQGPPAAGNAVAIDLPEQEVRSVRVVSQATVGYNPIRTVEVRVGDQVVAADMVLTPGCDPAVLGSACTYEADVPLDPTVAGSVVVGITDVGGPSQALGGKIRIDEIEINGEPNVRPPGLDQPFPDCIDLGLTVEATAGEVVDVPVRPLGTPAQVLAGQALPLEACDEVTLANGLHLLETAENAPIDRLQLQTTDPVPPTDPVPTRAISLSTADPTSLTFDAEVDGEAIFVLAQSYDPRWRAFVDGEPIGRSLPYDGLNGWRVEADGPVVVELRYPPQRVLRLALALTTAGVVVCAWLVLRRPRRGAGADG